MQPLAEITPVKLFGFSWMAAGKHGLGYRWMNGQGGPGENQQVEKIRGSLNLAGGPSWERGKGLFELLD